MTAAQSPWKTPICWSWTTTSGCAACLHRYLTSNGFRVTTAADAAEARALMKSIDFDCLILDVMMPGEIRLRSAKSAARPVRRFRS